MSETGDKALIGIITVSRFDRRMLITSCLQVGRSRRDENGAANTITPKMYSPYSINKTAEALPALRKQWKASLTCGGIDVTLKTESRLYIADFICEGGAIEK